MIQHCCQPPYCCIAGKPALRRGATFTFRPADAAAAAAHTGSSPQRSSLRRTISVPVTSTSRDTAPLAYHAKVTGASRAAVAGTAVS